MGGSRERQSRRYDDERPSRSAYDDRRDDDRRYEKRNDRREDSRRDDRRAYRRDDDEAHDRDRRRRQRRDEEEEDQQPFRGGQKRDRPMHDDDSEDAAGDARRDNNNDNSHAIRRTDGGKPMYRDEKEQRRAARAAEAANEKSAGLASSIQHYTPGLGTSSLEQEAGLHERFVWQKKVAQQKEKGLTDRDLQRIEQERKEAALVELEKLAKKRQEREAIQRVREEEKKRMQREKDEKELGDVRAKEEEYHLETAKERAMVRIRESRPHPIDGFVLNMALAEEPDKYLEMARWQPGLPYGVLTETSDTDLEELYNDCQFFSGAEKRPQSNEAWQAMLLLSDHELSRREKRDARSAVPETVASEIEEMLREQDYRELGELQTQIEEKLQSDDPGDIEYWEELYKQTAVFRTRAKMRMLYERLMAKHIQNIIAAIKELGHQAETQPDLLRDATGDPTRLTKMETSIDELEKAYLRASGKEVEEVTRNENEEDEDAMMRTKMFTLEEDEEVFKQEVATSTQYHWKDKYRPRKPKYFNRVQAGFEWNKYNQTHYDFDNPPPKIVQGYKFNIFYPDLIDKSKAPYYVMKKDPDAPDTCILIFKAGPPYEDIAFRVVKREWEFAHRRGYKCSFDRGVLQLHFNFKRVFYRR